MILTSNGVRTFIFENNTLDLCDIDKSYRGPGYCFEIATYPSQDQTSLTAINNVAAPACAENAKGAQCMINFDAKNYTWATVVDRESAIYNKIIDHYIAHPEPTKPEATDDFNADKLEQIRELLSSLTEKEVAALTKK